VKFLVDAQLPRSLAALIISAGHDAIHTLDLPDKNCTTDEVLCRIALSEQRVLVTKDGGFVDSFLLRGLPPKLLFVTTGNISNEELLALFRGNLQSIVAFLTALSCFVEIDRNGLTIRD
jgi:predicted nuclease of predicted toxin-antitoxin system